MNPGCAAEQHAWREVKEGWRPLYGDVDKIGVAVEWHDFRTECLHAKDIWALTSDVLTTHEHDALES